MLRRIRRTKSSLAILLLVAACSSGSDAPGTSDSPRDATIEDSHRRDDVRDAGSSDATDALDTIDASRADANDDVVSSADAANEDSADVPSPRDIADGDAGCACIAFDNSDPFQPPVELSLECFAVHARWYNPYSVYTPDICADLPPAGIRRVDTYADPNLIGIWSFVSSSMEPQYGYFYDATTKELVGAVRAASYGGGDPSSCSGPGQLGKNNRVYAGKIPNCDFAGGTVNCPATTSQPDVCRRADAGASDASADADTRDTGAMDVATSDVDASDATTTETAR